MSATVLIIRIRKCNLPARDAAPYRTAAKWRLQRPARNDLRQSIYVACRQASPEIPIWACDAPVGSGKTTAVMAYLLQAAIALHLRHIFVVLPFTNIINQSVAVYRKALALPDEDPKEIVAAHHHATEFKTPTLRALTTTWNSPVIVTTAVQFFETLAASATPRLRKLHALPGSVLPKLFVDRCMPSKGHRA
jgi:CRISPR-associated endonuclease/helicase Cas3